MGPQIFLLRHPRHIDVNESRPRGTQFLPLSAVQTGHPSHHVERLPSHNQQFYFKNAYEFVKSKNKWSSFDSKVKVFAYFALPWDFGKLQGWNSLKFHRKSSLSLSFTQKVSATDKKFTWANWSSDLDSLPYYFWLHLLFQKVSAAVCLSTSFQELRFLMLFRCSSVMNALNTDPKETQNWWIGQNE